MDGKNENSVNPLTSLSKELSTRREFLIIAGAGGAGVAVMSVLGYTPKEPAEQTPALTPGAPKPQVYVYDAKGMLVHHSERCVGCRRCEIACTISHDGKDQPSIARVKVQRNRRFGPEGPRVGFGRGEGLFGNFRVIADTCLQCPHPVSCMTACPEGAIGVDPTTGARVIDANKCVGCQTCLKACPWAMTSFDKETKKATKCDLCGGDPQCVKWCPSGAMQYEPWLDRTKVTPIRQVVPAYISPPKGVAESCAECHQPAGSATK